MKDVKFFLPSMTFGTGRTVHHLGRREGGMIVVVHILGFSLLVLMQRAKELACDFSKVMQRRVDLDPALPAFWPDSLMSAEL